MTSPLVERVARAPHRGPVCKACGVEFYYDYFDKPEPHEGSGLCLMCWSDEQMNARAQRALDAALKEG